MAFRAKRSGVILAFVLLLAWFFVGSLWQRLVVWPAVRLGMDCARTEGTIVIAARHTTVPQFNPVGHPYLGKKLTLLTTYGYEADGQRWDRRHSVALTVDLLRRKRLDIAPMITHRMSWSDIPEIYRRLDAGEPGMAGVVCGWKEEK